MTKPLLINFPLHTNDNGTLGVYETGKSVPFKISRVFTVTAKKDEVRGHHAHKECSQLLVCVSGVIKVICDDGINITEYKLQNMGHGLLIPPGLWAYEEYLEDDTVVMVLCDHGYEESDYIRDYNTFKIYVGLKK
jgi:dTDP-4-dehydrorhamnose 3,5-epimerase-like enzyme